MQPDAIPGNSPAVDRPVPDRDPGGPPTPARAACEPSVHHAGMGIALRLGLLALLVAGGLGAHWLWVATQVGAGFAAKVTCSLVFISGQGAKRVLDDYGERFPRIPRASKDLDLLPLIHIVG